MLTDWQLDALFAEQSLIDGKDGPLHDLAQAAYRLGMERAAEIAWSYWPKHTGSKEIAAAIRAAKGE